jgi:pimeloyl-ACP methyl ester carboxylesterase
VTTRKEFSVDVEGGQLRGWLEGRGAPVLALHGGPGMSNDYLSGMLSELAERYEVASYQQRGVGPSTARSPYDVATQVGDALAVLDHLGWDAVTWVGHSWGGHLLLHAMTRHPERVAAACVVDPLGGVGDGGLVAFGEELSRRTPAEDRERAETLDQLALEGKGTPADLDESLRLLWPAYFPTRESAPAYESISMSTEAYSETFESLVEELPALEARLGECAVPTIFVHGGASPMPVSASAESADRLRDATVDVVDDAGHFIWLDHPGAVVGAVDRLSEGTRTAT